MLLQISGNVPGLQNAGVMWAQEFTAFLLGFGFTQPIVDRRLFYLHDAEELLLMVGTFVDDCKLVVQNETMAAAFNREWDKRYRDPPGADVTARDFLGLKYVRATDEGGEAVTISCGKAVGDLEAKLSDLQPAYAASCLSPRRRCGSWSASLGPGTP